MPLSADIARLRVMEPAAERRWVHLADFKQLDDQGRCRVSIGFHPAPRAPRAGEHVYLMDAEGRGCVGTVEQVEAWHAQVRPDWRTWTG